MAFTDDDALPDEGWLQALTEPLLGGPDELAGTGGPVAPIVPEEAPAWFHALLDRYPNTFIGPSHDLGQEACDYAAGQGADTPIGANCAYRRALLVQHPYRADLGPNAATGMRGGEDTELGLRLRRAGYRLRYVPGARVRHPIERERTEMKSVLRAYRMQGIEAVRLRRVFGESLEAPEALRRKIREHGRHDLLLRLVAPSKAVRHRLRRELYRGMLAETANEASRG